MPSSHLSPLGAPLEARPGRPVLLQTRAHEVRLAVDAVSRGQGGYIWTAPVGSGKSSLLELILDALADCPPNQPHVVVHLTARPPAGVQAPISPGGTETASGHWSGPAHAAQNLMAAADTLISQLARHSGVDAPEDLRGFLSGTTDHHHSPELVGAALARYIHAALTGTTIVVVVDDMDDLDHGSRALALDLVAHHQIPSVLLAAAARITWDAPLPYPVVVRKIAPLSAQEALRLLTHHHLMEASTLGLSPTTARGGVAPTVAGALARQLSGNTACLIQTAAELTSAQLDGTSILPNPLPAVPALAELHGPDLVDLTPAQRRALLIAAVTVVDRIDVLLGAASITMDEILATPLATVLRFAGGRFAFAHLGVRALVHSEATVAERTEAHAALAQTLSASDPDDAATWHRTLASLAGDPRVCPDLLTIAERLIDRGDVVHAHEVAREAACQGEGSDRAAAERLAGVAALRSGHIRDAAEWLRPAMRSDDREVAACALPAYVVAVAALHGQVPDDEIAQLVESLDPAADSPTVTDGLVRALAISGRIHAERGDADLAVTALEGARTLARGEVTATTRDALSVETAWASMFAAAVGTSPPAVASARSADRQTFASTARALHLALDGDLGGAARILTHALTTLSPLDDGGPWWAVSHRAASPFAEAHLRVAKALVDMWSGDFLRAGDELHAAAFRLPLSLPFAGLGTAAARRLSILQNGHLDDVATALSAVSTAAAPHPVRREAHIDRSILAALSGQPHRRDTSTRITEESAKAELSDASETRFPELPGMADATTLGPPGPASAYQRAHYELMTARGLAAGTPERALEHLQSAVELFSSTGAHAWTRIAEADIDRLSRAGASPADEALPTALSTQLHGRWGAHLTQRELAVALLVVQGASNRDVAQALHLSVRTVEVHLGRVFRKTGARSRVGLTVLAHTTL